MQPITKKNFKDLSQMTVIIADRFFQARKMCSLMKEDYLAEYDFSEEEFNNYLTRVQKAFNSLNEAERNLINNEFFFQSYHHWWESIYSKATFYRYKKEAMQKFLGAFYDA